MERRWLAVASLCVGLSCSGCTSKEVRLWPLVDIERPRGSTGGVHAEVLWPFIELDTTDDTDFAVRPLLAYDSGRGKGSFLWPLGWFDVKNFGFSLWPLYSWKRWNEATRSGHHFVLPFGGYRQRGDARSWWVGPGLFGSYGLGDDGEVDIALVPPFVSYRNEAGTERTLGALIPPFYYHKEADERSLLLLNYYNHRSPTESSDVLFPLLWWQQRQVSGREHWHRELFPLLGWSQVTDPSLDEPVRRTRMRALWPLCSIEWGPEATSSHILALIGWRYHLGELVSHRVLPFYAKGREYSAVPILGYGTWDRRTEGAVGEQGSGWVAWPFMRRSQHFFREEPTDVWQRSRYDWSFVLDLVGWGHQYDRQGEWKRVGHHVWPLYEYDTWAVPADVAQDPAEDKENAGEQDVSARATSLHMFAGLLRRETGPDRSEFAFPYPLAAYERTQLSTRHRLWPLYRYSATGEHRDDVEFTALAELISVRHGVDISEGPEVLLRPFSYQRTAGGDHELRLFWKLFESSRRGSERRWGLHPLLYQRSSEKDSAWYLLGGLLGRIHDQQGSRTRLLWLFEV
ncbi:MAG: hypothetical protein AAF581_13900 [Planctomycetota bacterium]